MDRKKILATLVSLAVLLSMVPMTVGAADVTIDAVAPDVRNVIGNLSDIAVNAYCKVSFDLDDNNGVNTTSNVTVNTWVNSTSDPEGGTGAVRSAYVFKWDNSTFTWTSSPSGYVSDTSTNLSALTGNSTTVDVVFKVNKTAVPTVSGTWEVNASVIDEDALTNNDHNSSVFDVNSYVEGAAETGIDFGSAVPGAGVGGPTTATTITFTSNANVTIAITGADFSGAQTIPVGNFFFNATNSGEGGSQTPTVLTTGSQNAYTMDAGKYAITEDALSPGISGYTLGHLPDIAFNGTIPIPCRSGAYSATWDIAFTAATAT